MAALTLRTTRTPKTTFKAILAVLPVEVAEKPVFISISVVQGLRGKIKAAKIQIRKEDNTMRDLQEKLQAMDAADVPEPYRTIMELPQGKNINAVIRCAENANNPYLWQVVTTNTSTHFKTLAEAMDYCRQRELL